MTHTLDTHLDRHSSTALGVFRIIIGLLFTLHGTSKLFGWPSSATGTVPVGTWPFWWAGVIELIVGLLVLLGLFTRVAALIGSGEMAFAYFTTHQAKAFWPIENGGELAVLYCFALLLSAFVGAGAFAIGGSRSRTSARD